MSLTVDTREVKRNDLDVFAVGVHLMAIGLEKITEKNVVDAQGRIDLINALDLKQYGKESLPYSATDMLGASANVLTIPFPQWSRNTIKHFLRRSKERMNEKSRLLQS